MSARDDSIKKMADMLRGGATMLSHTCPDCKTPLFRLTSGETVCPICNRKAVFARASEVEKVAAESATTLELEDVLLHKISRLKTLMANAETPDAMEKIARAIMVIYDLLERVRKKT